MRSQTYIITSHNHIGTLRHTHTHGTCDVSFMKWGKNNSKLHVQISRGLPGPGENELN